MGWLVFDYWCECGVIFEALVSSSNPDTTTCRNCGAEATRLPAAPLPAPDAIGEGCPRAWRRWAEQHERPRKRIRHV